MAGNLTLTYEEVDNAAKKIVEISEIFKQDIDRLIKDVEDAINSGVQANWAEAFQQKLSEYSQNDMAQAIKKMQNEAEKCVEMAKLTQAYSEEKGAV